MFASTMRRGTRMYSAYARVEEQVLAKILLVLEQ